MSNNDSTRLNMEGELAETKLTNGQATETKGTIRNIKVILQQKNTDRLMITINEIIL